MAGGVLKCPRYCRHLSRRNEIDSDLTAVVPARNFHTDHRFVSAAVKVGNKESEFDHSRRFDRARWIHISSSLI